MKGKAVSLYTKIALCCLLIQVAMSCSTGGSDQSQTSEMSNEVKAPTANNAVEPPKAKQSDVSLSRASRKAHTYSLGNTRMTSTYYDLAKANQSVNRHKENSKSLGEIESRIASMRYAKSGVSSVWPSLENAANLFARQNYQANLPGEIKLDVALLAIADNDFDLAEYLLVDLLNSSKSELKAAALNAVGLIYIKEGRVPEAVLQWQAALKTAPDFKAAQLNLGFIALKHGDFENAKRYLGNLTNDWYASSGLMIVDRHEGNAKMAESKCERLLSSQSKNKLISFNCGLFYYQEEGQAKKAKDLLTESATISQGPSSWSEKAYALIGRIENAELKAAAAKEAGPPKEAIKNGPKK